LRGAAEKFSAECVEQQERLPHLVSAHCLAKAGFKLNPEEFGLPCEATSAGDQEIAARTGLETTTAARSDLLGKLEPFMAALRQRVTLALRLGQANAESLKPGVAGEVTGLARLLAAVAAEMPRAYELNSKEDAFLQLVRNRGNTSSPAQVDAAVSKLETELQSLITGIQERLKPFAYPFPHARGSLTVAEYARYEKPTENEWQRLYLDCHSHVDRVFSLHYRLVGRILSLAEEGEEKLRQMEERRSEMGKDKAESGPGNATA
jgi:hypothetical protein